MLPLWRTIWGIAVVQLKIHQPLYTMCVSTSVQISGQSVMEMRPVVQDVRNLAIRDLFHDMKEGPIEISVKYKTRFFHFFF